MKIAVETTLFDFFVIDQFKRSTFSAPNTKVDTIKGCINKFIEQFNVYDEQHIFWQPPGKSNVRLLSNTNDFGQLGNFLHKKIKCNIFIGEEALRKDDVILSRKCLNIISEQLSILERSISKAQNQVLQSSEVEGKKCIILPEDKPELIKFFSKFETSVQLQEVYEGYKVYEKLLQKFDGQKKRMESFLNENTPMSGAEAIKQINISEELKEKGERLTTPNDPLLHVEVSNKDNSLHFILYNKTNIIIPGNCTFEFSSQISEVFSIKMGPHEIGIKGQKELWFFPSLPTPLSNYTMKVVNQDGDTILVGKCADSNEITLKSPLASFSTGSFQTGSFHTLQDPTNVFRADALSSPDESSIMSTPFLGETDEVYNSGYTLSRPFTWEEI
ncbi:BCN_G0048110.mRNA.1.CDS.1 [Saccharomyces cerevisiae]|nr:BCN_G0048110.mRNA.1.CDS.1 [Saccharomyces cerevisiae]CAI4770075.1 BCE_3a_G0048200.mRNA.1.CDS.1 [Saccharomyces cerevisiae]CAI7322825.1 BCN_G0048110.mRNA.1.CDS.1 [Saccharomyces cerevisiae]CAI7327227.1 BCE_3a_G0048200.mRNA.1.CDS.1 [Saccharomyces cerevisiae]